MPTNVPATQAAGLPAMSADDLALMQEGSKTGVESFSMKQLVVPYLFIVQGSSDYVKRGQAKFIDAAREGDIMDSLMLTPLSEAHVIACKFEDHSTEWKPNQGGLVKQWFTDHSKYFASAKKSADDFDGMPRVTSEGHEITLVPTYYCLLFNPETGRARPLVLSMASTQAKKSRRWNGLIDALEFQGLNGSFTAPIYARSYRLTTVPEKGRDNTTFAGWKIDPGALTLTLPNGRALWEQAQEVRKQVEDGVMKMAAPTEVDITPAATTAPTETRGTARRGSARGTAPTDDGGADIPF